MDELLWSNDVSVIKQTLFWWLTIIWSLLVLISGFWYQSNLDQQVVFLATEHAQDNWRKDAAFRRWATQHGGLYVPSNERTPPNPGLAHIPHRDVQTRNGADLTLMNPAYMMRQMTQEFEQMYGVKGKITGKVLLNPPINMPDDWELKVLELFDSGQLEPVIEVKDIDREPYLRLMKPMLMTEQGCVDCHGHLGFKLGDVRGGVSVSVPLSSYKDAVQETKQSAMVSHWISWLIGMIGIWFYQTRQIQQEDLKREMERKIQHSLRMGSIGQMAGGIAHDFNNILSIVVGNAEVLSFKLSDQKQKSQVAKVIAAAERGSKLIRQLLDFSREETGELSSFNPAVVLSELLDMLHATAPGNIKVIRNLDKQVGFIQANRTRFEDCITNLILNAIDAVRDKENGTIAINVSCDFLTSSTDYDKTVKLKDKYCHIEVIDNGHGMEAATKERIFEPFYTTKKQGKGTGLGLSQVYGFVQAHDGFIDVHSEPDEGTRFDLYLPISLQTESETNFHQKPALKKGSESILIVDDEPEIANLIKQFLDGMGYTSYLAENGEVALTKLQNFEIDALITDVMMPDMNGYQLVRLAREIRPNLPVIFVSGYSVKEIESRYDDVQSNSERLDKPFSHNDLIRALQELLTRNKQ